MYIKNVLVKATERMVVTLAKKIASVEANTACPLWGYQSKESIEIKKLRKF